MSSYSVNQIREFQAEWVRRGRQDKADELQKVLDKYDTQEERRDLSHSTPLGEDALRSILPGLHGVARTLGGDALNYTLNKLGVKLPTLPGDTAAAVRDALHYQPKTAAGRYSKAAVEGAGTAAIPGGVGPAVASRLAPAVSAVSRGVGLPAVAAEGAGGFGGGIAGQNIREAGGNEVLATVAEFLGGNLTHSMASALQEGRKLFGDSSSPLTSGKTKAQQEFKREFGEGVTNMELPDIPGGQTTASVLGDPRALGQQKTMMESDNLQQYADELNARVGRQNETRAQDYRDAVAARDLQVSKAEEASRKAAGELSSAVSDTNLAGLSKDTRGLMNSLVTYGDGKLDKNTLKSWYDENAEAVKDNPMFAEAFKKKSPALYLSSIHKRDLKDVEILSKLNLNQSGSRMWSSSPLTEYRKALGKATSERERTAVKRLAATTFMEETVGNPEKLVALAETPGAREVLSQLYEKEQLAVIFSIARAFKNRAIPEDLPPIPKPEDPMASVKPVALPDLPTSGNIKDLIRIQGAGIAHWLHDKIPISPGEGAGKGMIIGYTGARKAGEVADATAGRGFYEEYAKLLADPVYAKKVVGEAVEESAKQRRTVSLRSAMTPRFGPTAAAIGSEGGGTEEEYIYGRN